MVCLICTPSPLGPFVPVICVVYVCMYACTYVCMCAGMYVYVCMYFNTVFILKQINDNGVISFNSRYNVRTPLSLPLSGTRQIIAPYWADVDTRGNGQILYRQSIDSSLLARASREIQEAFPSSQNVTIRNLLIATWDEVGYYSQNDDKVHKCYVYNVIQGQKSILPSLLIAILMHYIHFADPVKSQLRLCRA